MWWGCSLGEEVQKSIGRQTWDLWITQMVNFYRKKSLSARKTCPHGIPEKKKEDILRNCICPMMPKSRCKFWEMASVIDLIDEYEQ